MEQKYNLLQQCLNDNKANGALPHVKPTTSVHFT